MTDDHAAPAQGAPLIDERAAWLGLIVILGFVSWLFAIVLPFFFEDLYLWYAGFWLVNESFGMTVPQTLRSWTAMKVIT